MSLFLGHIYQDTIPDAIFLRDAATPLFSTSPGGALATQNIDLPNREVGDRLLVLAAGGVQGPIPPTANNWTLEHSFSGGAMGVYTRVATNTSADDYRVLGVSASLAGPRWHLQMISVASTSPGTVTRFQNGTQRAGSSGNNDLDFTLESIAVGSEANDTWVLGVFSRSIFLLSNSTEPTVEYPTGMVGINKMTSNTADSRFPTQDHLYECGWSYVFQPVSALIAAQNITYTPVLNGLGGTVELRTQYFRYRLVP